MWTPRYSRLEKTSGTITMGSASVWMSSQRCCVASALDLPRERAWIVLSHRDSTTPRDLYPSFMRLKLSRTNTSMQLEANCLM